MSTFNTVAGIASIASLALSIWALKRVHDVEVKINVSNQSQVSQEAQGQNIKQAGRDLND